MPSGNRPRLSHAEALEAGREAIGLITVHEDRLLHRGINESFRNKLHAAVRILEQGTAAAKHREPIHRPSPQTTLKRELYQWIISFREAIERCFKENIGIRQTFGVGLTLDPDNVQQIFEHTKTLIHVAREHLPSVEAAGIIATDLDEAERMLEKLIAFNMPVPMVEETSSVRSERLNARRYIEKAVDRILASAAMEFRKEPEIKDLFFSILPHSESANGL